MTIVAKLIPSALPLAVGLLLVSGCAKVPQVQVWRPWTRVLGTEAAVPVGATIRLSVEGDSDPLLGDEALLQQELQSMVASLLERRGFRVSGTHADCELILRYRTQRHDKHQSLSITYVESRSTMVSVAGTKQSTNLGVAIASALIAGLTSKSSTEKVETTETMESYSHALSLELMLPAESPIWKGEAAWDSQLIDAVEAFPLALQLLISNLPKSPETVPTVPLVREDRDENFFNLYCRNKWFSCPALPYRVVFVPFAVLGTRSESIPRAIKNREAFAAYLDLVQTAEDALPLGLGSYENPLDRSLWSKVRLGRRYYLGSDSQTTPILITLSGSDEGYSMDGCHIASEEEYEEFLERMKEWRTALLEYYDIYGG